MYQVVKVSDPKLQNVQNVTNCVHILSFLRLVMQVILPIEKLCWLVYNGMSLYGLLTINNNKLFIVLIYLAALSHVEAIFFLFSETSMA